MTTESKSPSRKLGANRKELAQKRRPNEAKIGHSRDIHEDRGERQMKTERARQTLPHLLRSR